MLFCVQPVNSNKAVSKHTIVRFTGPSSLFLYQKWKCNGCSRDTHDQKHHRQAPASIRADRLFLFVIIVHEQEERFFLFFLGHLTIVI